MSTGAEAGKPASNIWSDFFARVATCPEAQVGVLGPLCGDWTADAAVHMIHALLTIVEYGDRQKAVLAAHQLRKFVRQGASVPSYALRFYSVLEAGVRRYVALDDFGAAEAMVAIALKVYWPGEANNTVGALLELAVQTAIHEEKRTFDTFASVVVRKVLALSKYVESPLIIYSLVCGAWTKLARHGVDAPKTVYNVSWCCEAWMAEIRSHMLRASRVAAFPAAAMADAADLLAAVPPGCNMHHTASTLWELLAAANDATLHSVMNSNKGHLYTRIHKDAQDESSGRVASRIATIDAFAAKAAAKEAEMAAREAALRIAKARADAAEQTVARIKQHVRQLLGFGGVSIGDATPAETNSMTADHLTSAGDGASIGAGDGALVSAGDGASVGAGDGTLVSAGDGTLVSAGDGTA
jgi:hypothetical protein